MEYDKIKYRQDAGSLKDVAWTLRPTERLRADKNNRLLCPFHQDKTPSLQVYPPTNTWTCFSSNCDAGSGDAIEFIQRMDKISKHEALLKAAELIDNGKWAMDNEKTVKDVTVLAKESLSPVERSLRLHSSQNAGRSVHATSFLLPASCRK